MIEKKLDHVEATAEALTNMQKGIEGHLEALADTIKPVGIWRCKANRTADPPQDCDWPFCGCDPYASKVVDAVAEAYEGRDEVKFINYMREKSPNGR